MEALLEKEGNDVENWNDDRLDELSRRMDAGFDRAVTKAEAKASQEEIGRRFNEVDKKFDIVSREFGRVNDRLDKLFYIQLAFLASLSAALISHAI